MVLRLPRAGSVPKGRDRRQLPPFQGRRLEQEGDTSETAGEGSRGEGGGADDIGNLTELPPWEDCGGGVGSPELREARLPRQGRVPHPSQPPAGVRGAAPRQRICRGCRERHNPPPPLRSPTPRPGASVPGSGGHLGAPRTPPPPPTSQTGTSPARGCGSAKPPAPQRPRRAPGPARPAPPPAGLARPLGFQNSAAPGEARAVHHPPDPRRLLLGFLKEVVAVAVVG
ncbi:unnamed protein product [Nyctereutes procyonoides]|uniref:(raccoon dog) hypothetical protein n=1 Tax=Nyctereutes procyonoides TaxID=34880 RepID=A0A811ZHQ0_NYCPR|nr:unnamed protein product [Nyctereutes procyonoides]